MRYWRFEKECWTWFAVSCTLLESLSPMIRHWACRHHGIIAAAMLCILSVVEFRLFAFRGDADAEQMQMQMQML